MSSNFPPLPQMQQFVADWDANTERLEKQIDQMTVEYTKRVSDLERQIADWKVTASEAERPLRQKIVAMETEVIQARAENERLTRIVHEVTNQLANVLETNPNLPGNSLEGMLKDMALLVQASKTTFRRNL